MNNFFRTYLTTWSIACLLAVVLYLRNRKAHVISHRTYRNFLWVPWKVVTFLISGGGMVAVAPYSGDPTWDYWDALFMSVLTFVTAPWAVGIVYRTLRRQTSFTQSYIAFCAWMFSVSWSYDLYILIRDGYYPAAWRENLIISSALYGLAGLLWNLDWRVGRGVLFAFQEPDWPRAPVALSFQRVFWIALVLMALATAFVLRFIWLTRHA